MPLPPVGSSELLALLSPFVPDELICALLPRRFGSGRRGHWTAAQLLRTNLLLLLTEKRFSNALCGALSGQPRWRAFAHLPHRLRTPTPRQLHEFRMRLTPRILRAINAHLLRNLLAQWPEGLPAVTLIDATDLPAMTNEYKKSQCSLYRAPGCARSAHAEDWPSTLVYWL